jgi:hypothetical protein
MQGRSQTWEPFKIKSSQFSVVDGAVTIQPPPAKK